MAKILIVYGTKQGQTKKIAEFIEADLKILGHSASAYDSRQVPEWVHPQDYDVVVVGGSVHMSGFPGSLKRWVEKWAPMLRHKPSAFFSVCLGILQNDPLIQQEERKIVEDFFHESSWRPPVWTIFAGALTYSKYNWFVKRMMKFMAQEAGFLTETDRDYEYTDWNKVREFAIRVSKLFEDQTSLSTR